MISADVIFRRNPDAPVAQNAQDRAHPTCVETQSVLRASSGISTLSTASPSSSRNRNFSVPSCDTSSFSTGGEEILHDFPISSLV